MNNPKPKELLAGTYHELIHVIHNTKHHALNWNAGDAFYYAEALLQHYNITKNDQVIFPNCKILQSIEKGSVMKLTKDQVVIIIAACIYYLDKSEMLAWVESFTGNMSSLSILRRFSDRDESRLYEECETYIIYSALYSLLVLHKNEISEIVRSDEYLKNYIHEYYKSLKQTYNKEVNKVKIGRLLTNWEADAHEFLRKCRVIAQRYTS